MAKATLWLWALRDIVILGVGGVLSVFAIAQLGLFAPVVATALYAFLSVRTGDISILDFIWNAVSFFAGKQQRYDWRL